MKRTLICFALFLVSAAYFSAASKTYAFLDLLKTNALFAPYLSNPTDTTGPGNPNSELLVVTKSGPNQVPDNNSDISYQITVRYTGTGVVNVQITDNLDQNLNVSRGSISDGGTYSNNTITWNTTLTSNNQKTVNFAGRSKTNNVWITNSAQARIVSGGGNGNQLPPVAGQPPSQNNCGKYRLNNPLGNFGDPVCNFTKDDLYRLLQQADPTNTDYWFYTVVRCESGYDPNAYLKASASGLGAYGLYQMNPGGKGSGSYDAGDVIWQQQSSNAINYNNFLIQSGRAWTYWACAKDRWYK